MNESRATRFQRHRRRRQMLGTGVTAGLLAVLAWTSPGAQVAAWAGNFGRPWPPAVAAMAALAAYAVAVGLLWAIVWWPLARLVRTPDDGAPLSRRTALVPDVLKEGAGAAALVFAGGGAIQAAVALAGAWWWALAGGAAASALVAAMHLGPGVIARSSSARPIQRPSLVEALGALARQVRVPIASVDELPEAATVTSTALVAGGGSARRVFIAHELMRDWSDDEIAVVVAHEFAHHAHRDLWRTLVLDVCVVAGGLWLSEAALRATGVAPDGVPATLPALPAIALVAGGVWVVTTPLRHALSRRQERAADLFALKLTGKANVFQTAIRRLAARHLAEERPSPFARWFFHRHPTPEERLQLSEDFARRAR